MSAPQFLRFDTEEPVAIFLQGLGVNREAWILERLRGLEDHDDETRLPQPLFTPLGSGRRGPFWVVTIDFESEAYLFIVRRRQGAWFVVHGLRDHSNHGTVPETEVAIALQRWEAVLPDLP